MSFYFDRVIMIRAANSHPCPQHYGLDALATGQIQGRRHDHDQHGPPLTVTV